MNNKFDELTKSLAQSVTRRGALKKFGGGLAGMALACFGLPTTTRAATYTGYCEAMFNLPFSDKGPTKWFATGACLAVDPATGICLGASNAVTGGNCPVGKVSSAHAAPCAGFYWIKNAPCSFSI